MTSLRVIALGIAGALVLVGPAAARNVDKREHRQEKRIEHGEKSGKLSPREASKLEGREDALEAREQAMRQSGGKLTHKERHQLNREENHLSHQIWRNKHDANGR